MFYLFYTLILLTSDPCILVCLANFSMFHLFKGRLGCIYDWGICTMKKRRDIEKATVSGAKVLLSSAALLPGFVGYGQWKADIIRNPQDTVLYLTAIFFLLDLCTFRYLFLDELQPRKGQALFRSAGWNFPTAALCMLASVLFFFVGIILFGAPILE